MKLREMWHEFALAKGVEMRRLGVAVAVSWVIVGVLGDMQRYALASPSVYVNPQVNFALIRRVTSLGFFVQPQSVQDPFAGEKAGSYLEAAVKRKGVELIELQEVAQRVRTETGLDVSRPLTPDEAERVALNEMPKHVDAVVVGYISAWGTVQREETRVYPIYVWQQGGWGVAGWVPVRSMGDATIVGATVAIVRLPGVGQRWVLAWQYSEVRIDRGGPFIWNRPRPPDELAKQLCEDVARAMPLTR